jgi:hypothetical protein
MDRAQVLRALALVMILVPAIARLMAPAVSLPFWDTDPLLSAPFVVGLSPAWQLGLDALMALGAVLLLSASDAPRARVALACALCTLGLLPIAYHARTSLEDARIGCAWGAAMLGACAVFLNAHHALVRTSVAACLAGLVGLMALKGAGQLLIEHPAIVENYKATREQVLAANGWSADSPMARAYERRLMQPEATGYLGFSNIYASLMAGAGALLAALCVGWWRAARDANTARAEQARSIPWPLAVLALSALGACAGVAMAGGKGGYAVLLLGLALLAVATLRPRLIPKPTLVLPALCALALLAVIARGVAGDALGERSLLFRCFYVDAAARVTLDAARLHSHPDLVPPLNLLGTGPAGFKEAYVLYKNPLSPEDVASPHCAPLDWSATLGPLGLAWTVLAGWWLVRAGRALTVISGATDAGEPPLDRLALRAACLVPALATLLVVSRVSLTLGPDELLYRLGGLATWCACAYAVCRSPQWALRLGLTLAAGVLGVHAMIEQTLFWSMSAPLILLVLGAAGAGTDEPAASDPAPIARRTPALTFAALALVMTILITLHAGPVARWEGHLHAAITALGAQRDLSKPAGPIEPSVAQLRAAAQSLQDAQQALQGRASWPTQREQSRLHLLASQRSAVQQDPHGARDSLERSLASAGRSPRLSDDANTPALTGSQHAHLALMLRAAAQWAPGIQSSQDPRGVQSPRELLAASAQHLRLAQRADPSNPAHAVQLMDAYDALGQKDEAAKAAAEALRLDALQRYDTETRGLTDRQRARAQRLMAR